MPDTARNAAGLGARSGKHVAALAARNRRTGILGNKQPAKRRRLEDKLRRCYPYRRSGRMVKRVGRQAAPCVKLGT